VNENPGAVNNRNTADPAGGGGSECGSLTRFERAKWVAASYV
jgi:hypothetical protein